MGTMVKRYVIALVCLCVGLIAALPEARADFSYGDYEGMTVNFLGVSESSSTDPAVQLFGQPTLVANTFLYFPTNFTSTATGGGSDTTEGTLEMTLMAKPGYAFTGIQVTEIGSYALTGDGSASTGASVSGELTVGGRSADLSVTDGGVYSMPASGGFYTATAFLDFSGLGMTALDFTLRNLLETSSETGTTATISKSFANNKVEVEFYTAPVPVPGAVWLLGSALAPLCWLRRRRRT